MTIPIPFRRQLGRLRRAVAHRPPVAAPGRSDDPDTKWFWDHYESAASQIEEFLGSSGVPLTGRVVADVGVGDGIMALGLFHRTQPARLVGFDVNPVDRAALAARARKHGVAAEVPAQLEFVRSDATRLPAEDDSFDVVYSWSAFEHISDPAAVLREIRRVLKHDGAFMLQLWPFYYSSHGSHLWEWFPEPYHHLVDDHEAIVSAMRVSDRHTPELTEYMIGEFQRLNRVTLDDLQQAVVSAGLTVRKLEVMGEASHLPAGVERYPLSQLGISGAKLLATPA